MSTILYYGPNQALTGPECVRRVWQSALEEGYVAVDTETISTSKKDCIGIGLATRECRVYVNSENTMLLRVVLRLLGDRRFRKVYHNLSFDLHVLNQVADKHGWEVPDWVEVADCSVMAQVQGLPASLQDLTGIVINKYKLEIPDILPKRKTMLDLPFHTEDERGVADKCLDDVDCTLANFYQMGGSEWFKDEGHWWSPKDKWAYWWDPRLPDKFWVTREMKECFRVDMKLVPVLMKMGRRGMALREKVVDEWYEKMWKEASFYKQICMQNGFNPASPQQVGMVLAKRGNLLPFTKSRKQYKTDDEELSKITDPLAVATLQYRKSSKLLGTYLTHWLGQERAYTHYTLSVSTGRLSSWQQNVQNIPKDLRVVFEPDSGVWTDSDASQIELRIFAFLSQDPTMVNAYSNHEDIHAITQLALWPGSDIGNELQRVVAKTYNFAMIYWGKEETLAKHTKLPVQVCRSFREKWFERYPVAYAWMQKQDELLEQGWVPSLFGRRIKLPNPVTFPQDHLRSCLVNFQCQGSAADIIKRAMLKCEQDGWDMAAQVHDEILGDGVYELDPGLEHIHPVLATPFKTKRGPIWSAPEDAVKEETIGEEEVVEEEELEDQDQLV